VAHPASICFDRLARTRVDDGGAVLGQLRPGSGAVPFVKLLESSFQDGVIY
jgi:hypothetical protein